MRRRRFIAGTAATTTFALAGCSGILGGGGGGGPKGVIRQFVNALNSGNVEKANSFYHPDATMDKITSQSASMFEEATVSIQSMSVQETTDTRATVKVTLKIEVQGSSQTSTSTIQLRKHQGKWRLYKSQSTAS